MLFLNIKRESEGKRSMNTGARTWGFRLAVVADLINESKKEGRKKMLIARKMRPGKKTIQGQWTQLKGSNQFQLQCWKQDVDWIVGGRRWNAVMEYGVRSKTEPSSEAKQHTTSNKLMIINFLEEKNAKVPSVRMKYFVSRPARNYGTKKCEKNCTFAL